jgi:hypothetical protein
MGMLRASSDTNGRGHVGKRKVTEQNAEEAREQKGQEQFYTRETSANCVVKRNYIF